MGIGLFVVLGAIVILVIVFAVKGITTVYQSEARVIERLGKYHRTLSAGIHIIWPGLDKMKEITWRFVEEVPYSSGDDTEKTKITCTHKKTKIIDLREILYDFPKQNAITKDNANLSIDALLYFQITDPSRAVYEIDNLPNAIEKLTQTTLRSVVGGMDLDETLSSRDTINTKLRAVLDEATDKWGVKVNRVELQEITPPQKIRDAMDSQMEAERARRAEVIVAEGRKTATILIAEGEAQSRVKVASAEAEAIAFITKAFAEEQMDPANYLIATKYIETLKEMVSGKDNKVVYLPYEATAILGSIGGIKELFRDHE